MKYSCKSELTYQQCGCLSLTIETKPKEQQVVAHYVTLHGNDPNTDTKLLPCLKSLYLKAAQKVYILIPCHYPYKFAN